MSKAEKFISDCTRNCSNIEYTQGVYKPSYHAWLTPKQARKAVGIAREETLQEIKEKLLNMLNTSIDNKHFFEQLDDYIEQLTNTIMKYKGYEINVSVAVCPEGTRDITEEFDTLREAKKEYPHGYDFWYLAAEVINKNGDLNPACWGKTKAEALRKLKRALKIVTPGRKPKSEKVRRSRKHEFRKGFMEGMLDFFFAIRYLTDGEKEEARKMLYFTSHARAVKQWPNERSRISSLQEAFTRGHLAGMHGWQGDMEMNNVQREVQLRVRLSNMK